MYHFGDVSVIHLLAREEPGYRQTDGHTGEEQAGASGDAHILGVHGHIGGRHAVWYREQQQVQAEGYAFEQDETVQRDGCARHGLLLGSLDAAGAYQAGQAAAQGRNEDGVE